MYDLGYPAFPVLSFVGFFLVLIPIPTRSSACNIGICSYIFWISVACVNLFVNSLVWRDSAINYSPIWCDICEYRRLVLFWSSTDMVSTSHPDRRRRVSSYTRSIALHQPSTLHNSHGPRSGCIFSPGTANRYFLYTTTSWLIIDHSNAERALSIF